MPLLWCLESHNSLYGRSQKVEIRFSHTSFLLMQLCGGIKSWKRAQDPTTGSPKGFGFCEFESAEGVLRALRLLNKYSLEGQELVVSSLYHKDTCAAKIIGFCLNTSK